MKSVWIYFILFIFSITDSKAQDSDWTLQQCLDSALLHNKNLQVSRNTILLGDAKVKEAETYLKPKLSANADYKYYFNLPYQLLPLSVFGGADGTFKEAQFGVPHNINTNLQFTMPLYNPQASGTIENIKIATSINKLQLQKNTEQLYFEISNLFYNAQILLNQLSFIDTNLINTQKIQKNINLLYQQKMANGIDVAKMKMQTSLLANQQVIVRSKYLQVIATLKFMMGVSADKKINVSHLIQIEKEPELNSNNTIEMQIVQHQNKLLANEIGVINKSEKFPTINLLGSYGVNGFGYDKQPNSFLKFFPIGFAGIQLNYSLFNGKLAQRKIDQKKIDIQNNQLAYEQILSQNLMQKENIVSQKLIAQKTIESAKEQIMLAKLIYNQTLLQQQQGLSNLSDIIIADNSLRESQQLYLNAIVEYLKADLEHKKITGNILRN